MKQRPFSLFTVLSVFSVFFFISLASSISECATLTENLISTHTTVRRSALQELEVLNTESKEEVVRALIRIQDPMDKVADVFVRMREVAVPALIEVLKDDRPSHRSWAAMVLERMGLGVEDAVPYLMKALEDEERYVRSSAYEALRKIAPRLNIEVPSQVFTWEERGYSFEAEFLDNLGHEAIYTLLSPRGKVLLSETFSNDMPAKRSLVFPYNEKEGNIYLKDYPNLMALSQTYCGNRCSYDITFYQVVGERLNLLAEHFAYSTLGQLKDLDKDGLPEIVSTNIFWGLWGVSMAGSPAIPAIFSIDRRQHRFVHSEKKFAKVWINETEKLIAINQKYGRSGEVSRLLFLAVKSLLIEDDEEKARKQVVDMAAVFKKEIEKEGGVVKLPSSSEVLYNEFLSKIKGMLSNHQ